MPVYRVAIASDHAGYSLKNHLLAVLAEWGHAAHDLGPDSDPWLHYPDLARPLCTLVASGEVDLGIHICGPGHGMTITANNHVGVRAATCWNPKLARHARAQLDANMLCLPAYLVGTEEAVTILETFLSTPYHVDRHK